MSSDPNKKASKFLSLVLRHDPERIGLHLDDQGWADVSDLIEKADLIRDVPHLTEIVETNAKQRFAFSQNRTKIRANQGHSISVDLKLVAQIPPKILYHGTADKFLQTILEDGLKKMSRRHVHLSSDLQTATAVGRRHGRVVVLKVDCAAMAAAGYDFYLSNNGVWLTDHVPAEFLTKPD